MAETLYLSSGTVAELLFGVAALPAGKRRKVLTDAIDGLLTLFDRRVLPFDIDAARHCAELAVKARKGGRGLPTPDGWISAIAASRNTAPFVAAGVCVVSAWEA